MTIILDYLKGIISFLDEFRALFKATWTTGPKQRVDLKPFGERLHSNPEVSCHLFSLLLTGEEVVKDGKCQQ